MGTKAILSRNEKHYFAEGTWTRSFEKLGAHPWEVNGKKGFMFAVWAPGAKSVHLVGTFNNWDPKKDCLKCDSTGIWHIFMEGVKEGELYKYVIESAKGELLYKADPYAFYAQQPPETASVVYDINGFKWSDKRWLNKRKKENHMEKPLNIYEVHLGSWKMHKDETYYTYEELADELISYVKEMGYTHIELMPVMEHPFDGSWGYQVTGYYAPTSRYGEPKDFMKFVNAAHKAGIGVILDWVPGHFCRDAHGLGNFIGNKLYEKEDHAQWGTYKFDLGRGEVRSFLTSNLIYWLSMYHIDGIRVDGVTSMLYLNFGVDDEKLKKFNEKGTEEDLVAIDYIQKMNETVGREFPDVMMIAEESTAWPLVTYPPCDGGLGFHYKWDMGWMHDTLHYMQTDFPYREGNHNLLTFSMMYAFNENFILALSHDEVVHGKCSLIGRMPGDYWRQFAGLRLLALYQICHPGAKLNFMGSEIGEFIEWRYYEGLEWFLPQQYESHSKHQHFIEELNRFYNSEKALWQQNYSWEGFSWLDADNKSQSILSFIRKGKMQKDDLIVLLNCMPATYDNYRIGVPKKGKYEVVFNSDDIEFGGSGKGDKQVLISEKIPYHGMDNSISISVPPIGGVVLKRVK